MEDTSNTIRLTYKFGIWAQWLASACRFSALECYPDSIKLYDKRGRRRTLFFSELQSTIKRKSGWFWERVEIELRNGEKYHIGGVGNAHSAAVVSALEQAVTSYLQLFYQGCTPEISRAAQEVRQDFSGNCYIRQSEANDWRVQNKALLQALSRSDCSRYLPNEALPDYHVLQPFLENGHNEISRLNQSFVHRELQRFQRFFDQVESKPLTEAQRRACVMDEQHNLVLAGAGTGKTSTMIGRAGYLIQAGLAKPEQILLLAYARKAAEEMEQRINAKLGLSDLTVKTFHSLGKHIISQVEGQVPAIDTLAEDLIQREGFVERQFQALLKDDRYRARLLNYFVRFSFPYRSQFSFDSLGDYYDYIQENDIRTLQGEKVKSYEECEIANFLYRQGIAYQYEANYPVNTAGPDYKAYQPDFYLPEYGIYIEHFAINEQNQTPSFIEQASYLASMAWKRELHETHQTRLIETYSYLKAQGRLSEALREKLLAAGVVFKPLPQNKLLNQLAETGRISMFSQLMAQMLGLFKSANLSMKDFAEKASKHEDSQRMLAAAQLFEPIYESYQRHLSKHNSIDFDDMIGKAIEYVESGQFLSPYRYLLVDEFQDISAIRTRLLKALLSQHPKCSLFAVGDDWQSIYRFSGSDISFTKDFARHFGDTSTSVLDQTFRFNNQIGEAASRFVTQNPSQIAKDIRSLQNIAHPALRLIFADHPMAGIETALKAITTTTKAAASVLLLARFQFNKPDMRWIQARYPHLAIQFMTVHAAKGKEADYVVVFGLEAGLHGFPSEKTTHPLLELLLPPAEPFKHAEERRLFYVALTRARHQVYLVAHPHKPSCFVRELLGEGYTLQLEAVAGEDGQITLANLSCPVCETGFLVARDGFTGSYFGCTHYPLCTHTEKACQWCGGVLKVHSGFRVCERPRCDYIEPVCPKCNGTLIIRNGPYGTFWGCSNYRKEGPFSCTHKEQFIDLAAVLQRSKFRTNAK